MMDDNLDSNNNGNHNKFYNIQNLYDIWLKHINKYNITQHNFKLTHFRPNRNPSSLDHIYSNCPLKINNVTTDNNALSDHSIITGIYNDKEIKIDPTFVTIRKHKNLTDKKIQDAVKNLEYLNSIFNYEDPNKIANILQVELNTIIDYLTEPKVIQFTNKYVPFYNDEIKKMINTKNELLTNAINTKNIEDWHLFKNQNNIINKKIKEAKTNYYKEKFENNNNKWKTLKNINNTNKQTPPNIINNNGKLISSPKLIANIANNYFIEKNKANKK